MFYNYHLPSVRHKQQSKKIILKKLHTDLSEKFTIISVTIIIVCWINLLSGAQVLLEDTT